MAFTFKQGDRPLEGFTIQRGVGRGGFGEVYYALSDGGKEVALKYLRDNPQVELRGVAAVLNLRSPHLVAIHDVKQNAEGEWFVVMEFIAGPSMREVMLDAGTGGLGVQKAAFFLREIAKGLTYLHDRGIVHRDLKPGNIFYDEGYVKIGDYGLSKAIAASQHSGQTMSVGTVHYMAPEVGSGNYSKSIDVYSMGVMLYEMLLGRVPFEGATMGEVLMKHLTAQPEVDQLPAPFPHVIRKALAKDPNERYQTVTEMVNEVFAGQDMQASVNSFEPASISMAAARAARHMVPPVPGGPPRPAVGSSNVGLNAETLVAPRRDVTPYAPPLPKKPGGKAFLERLIVPGVLSLGMCFAVALVVGKDEPASRAIPAFAYIAAIVGGSMLGTWISFKRLQRVSFWKHRLINAAGFATCLLALLVVTSPLMFFMTSVQSRDGPSFPIPDPPNVSVKMERISERDLPAIGPEVESINTRMQEDIQHAVNDIDKAVAKTRSVKSTGGKFSRSKSTSYAPSIRTPSYPQPLAWALPLLAIMVLADWTGRVYRGRNGELNFGCAFGVGVGAFFIALFMGNSGDAWTIGMIAAAASVVVEVVSGLWPLAPGEAIPCTEKREKFLVSGGRAALSPQALGSDEFRRRAAVAAREGSSGAVILERAGTAAPPIMAGRGSNLDAAGRGMRGADAAGSDVPAPGSMGTPRSAAARAVWLIAFFMFLVISVSLYVFYGISNAHPRELTVVCMFATGLMSAALYSLTRYMPRIHKGQWRGVWRPMISFAGMGLIAVVGVFLGHEYVNGAQQAACIGMIMVGAVLLILPWLIPLPKAAAMAPVMDDESEVRWKKGKNLCIAGGSLLTGAVMFGAILSSALRGNDEEIALGITMPPMILGGIGLLIAGGITLGKAKNRGVRAQKLTLPITRTFIVPYFAQLGEVIEKHFMVHGYQSARQGNMFWSFERGNWGAQFWGGDVRSLKTVVNIAAFEVPEGYRLTCAVDMQNIWNQANQKDLAKLAAELDGLQTLLTGQADSARARSAV